MLILTALIQQSFGSPSHSNQRRKRNKKNLDWKRRSKTLFADGMVLYIENPKDATRKPLELINEFGKVERYETVSSGQLICKLLAKRCYLKAWD